MLTNGQLKVLELMSRGATLKSVAGFGSFHSPKSYLIGGPIAAGKRKRVNKETTFRALEVGGYILHKSGDGWMTSEWTISPKGKKALENK